MIEGNALLLLFTSCTIQQGGDFLQTFPKHHFASAIGDDLRFDALRSGDQRDHLSIGQGFCFFPRAMDTIGENDLRIENQPVDPNRLAIQLFRLFVAREG